MHKYRLLFILVFTCQISLLSQNTEIKVAFLADVHLQDLYGHFSDNEYSGLVNPATGKPVLLRTMKAQLQSTRIFNENYYAFLAALDDIAARGIKFVALPGDYTDDGQPIHLRGLQRILTEYNIKYGIEFFITTGNHDPVGPFAQHAGKSDFLGKGGKNQPVFSSKNIYKPRPDDLPVVLTADIAEMGYAGITSHLGNFGFLPKESYTFWATPFSTYDYSNYNHKTAAQQAQPENRQYEVLNGFTVPDASYVVEPVQGLWLLAIDGNVYIPKDKKGDPLDPQNYKGASLGYNNVLSDKTHLIGWVKEIVLQAKKHNKTLIAFSHYPMVEFNDDASGEIEQLMGKGKWQLDRVPVEAVAQTFADAGLRVHFGGHMHINDTGIHTTAGGNTLLNIQTPSLAAYIPAYKLLTIHPENKLEIETIIIKNVARFNELFPLYEMEYNHLLAMKDENIWNKEILEVNSYHEFTDFHLRELVRLRFLPDDWPQDFAGYLSKLSGEDLLILANIKTSSTFNDLANFKKEEEKEWTHAVKAAKKRVKANGLKFNSFSEWSGADLITDFYRIRNADELAITDIGIERIKQYSLISKCFLDNQELIKGSSNQKDLVLLFTILNKFLHGAPANHFTYDLETGKLVNLKK